MAKEIFSDIVMIAILYFSCCNFCIMYDELKVHHTMNAAYFLFISIIGFSLWTKGMIL